MLIRRPARKNKLGLDLKTGELRKYRNNLFGCTPLDVGFSNLGSIFESRRAATKGFLAVSCGVLFCVPELAVGFVEGNNFTMP